MDSYLALCSATKSSGHLWIEDVVEKESEGVRVPDYTQSREESEKAEKAVDEEKTKKDIGEDQV